MSRAELSRISGYGYNHIAELERGVHNASITCMDALAGALGVDRADLL